MGVPSSWEVACKEAAKFFKVSRRADGRWELSHKPSGTLIQRYLVNFARKQDAEACRDRMIACDPGFDWSDPAFAESMPSGLHRRVWDATYQ
jgi:hypothetical protein